MYQSYRPSYNSGPSKIPGLGALATTSSDMRTASPEPGEIVESLPVGEARVIALEQKVEQLAKDNDGLRQLVAHLCKSIARISEPAVKDTQPEQQSPADLFLETLASEMSSSVSQPSEEKMEDATAGVEAGYTSPSAVQQLSRKQEKLTKALLAVHKRLNSAGASFDNYRKEMEKALNETVKAQKQTNDEVINIKQTLDLIIEDTDQFRRTELHHRVKIAVNTRAIKESTQTLWDEVTRLTGVCYPRNIEHIANTRAKLKADWDSANYWASRLYNAALAGPSPGQDQNLHFVRQSLEDLRQNRRVLDPEGGLRPRPLPQDIEMLKGTIDWVRDTFVTLRTLNPTKWNNMLARQTSGEFGNGKALPIRIPSGPKRLREREDEDEEHDRAFRDRIEVPKRRR